MRELRLIPPLGHVFPPRGPLEVAAYDLDDVHQGYTEHAPGEAIPGENHAPGYRWGALNRQRDRSGRPDGHDHIRSAYLALNVEHRQ